MRALAALAMAAQRALRTDSPRARLRRWRTHAEPLVRTYDPCYMGHAHCACTGNQVVL